LEAFARKMNTRFEDDIDEEMLSENEYDEEDDDGEFDDMIEQVV
jgi:hypothetical protein